MTSLKYMHLDVFTGRRFEGNQLAVFFAAGSFYLIDQGHSTIGLSLITVDITVLAGLFVTGKLLQMKENKEKREALSGPPPST